MSNLNSTNKLTEFPPLEAEEKSDGKFSLSKFMFWRQKGLVLKCFLIFKLKYCSYKIQRLCTFVLADEALPPVAVPDGSLQQIPSASSGVVPQIVPPVLSTDDAAGAVGRARKISLTMPPQGYNLAEPNLANPSPEPSLDGYEARSLPNVLRRISSLIAMGSNV